MRDLDRLKCIQAVVDGDLKLVRASERLGLTTRQVRRLARRYAARGPVGLISKRFNRPSNNRLDDTLAEQVIKILRSTYADFGPTLATEKLRTKHGIDLAKETVRQLQIAVGLWIPRKLRPPKIQQPRMRRACIGELIQIDGCEHHWFEDRGPACTALVFIDDATSRLCHDRLRDFRRYIHCREGRSEEVCAFVEGNGSIDVDGLPGRGGGIYFPIHEALQASS